MFVQVCLEGALNLKRDFRAFRALCLSPVSQLVPGVAVPCPQRVTNDMEAGCTSRVFGTDGRVLLFHGAFNF